MMARPALTPADLDRGRHLGSLLREARGARSVSEVAVASGLSSETVRKVEGGQVATPAFSTVAALAGVLGVSLDLLWEQVGRQAVVRQRLPGI